MFNRAIEDAADFSEFRDALTRRNLDLVEAEQRRENESRGQRRARERAERKAATKAKVKA
jgi:hypothetical protein